MQKQDPLPPIVFECACHFCKFYRQVCLTGSAPLVKYIHNLAHANSYNTFTAPFAKILHSAHSNDIDIYIGVQDDRDNHIIMVRFIDFLSTLKSECGIIFDAIPTKLSDTPYNHWYTIIFWE